MVVAQLEERLTVDQAVAGSNPASHPIFLLDAPVAQRIEHRISAPMVAGSNPAGRTILSSQYLRTWQKEVALMEILKVATNSKPNAVAGALAGVLREKGFAEMQAIGAGAVNQAIKAIAIARGYVAPSGMDLVCIPSFSDVEIDSEVRTAVRFFVEPKK